MKKRFYIFILFLISGILGFTVSLWYHDEILAQNNLRTIQTFHYPATFVNQLSGDPDAGRKIFKEFCAACHDKHPVIDVKAPRIYDKAAWQARRKLGMPLLLKITTMGVGAMPARGGCFECSDQQLEEAILYILHSVD